MATNRELNITRDQAVKVVKDMAVAYRDKHIPGIARRRMSEMTKAALRAKWTMEMEAYIFALRALGDFEL